MADASVPDTWLPVLDDIADWVVRRDAEVDIEVGHVQGPHTSNMHTWLPIGLQSVLDTKHDLIRVVAVSCSDRSKQTIEQLKAVPLLFRSRNTLNVVDYQTLIEQLRNAKNTQNEPVVIVLDVDLDHGAAFMLALAAALAWSDTLGTMDERVSIRVLTLSPEPLHGVTRDLLGMRSNHLVTYFALPPTGREPQGDETIFIEDVKNDEGTIGSFLQQVAVDPLPSYTVLSFRPESSYKHLPENVWAHGRGRLGGFPKMDRPGHRIFISATTGDRSTTIGTGSSYMHVILSDQRRRKIFDRKTSQIVQVDLQTSNSERVEQMYWKWRGDALGPNTKVYMERDFLQNGGNDRRLSVMNHQLEGFLVGLTGFYLDINTAWVLAVLGRIDTDAIIESSRRLARRGLVRWEGADSLSPVFAHEPIKKVFYSVLHYVDYDTRLAQLLAEHDMKGPRNPKLALVKVQIAAYLTARENTVTFDPTAFEGDNKMIVRQAANFGYTGSMADTGTFWLKLGLLKRAISESRLESGQRVPSTINLLNGLIHVKKSNATAYLYWVGTYSDMMRENGVQVASPREEGESGRLSHDEIHGLSGLYWSLARCFIHQVAVFAYIPGILHMVDFVTKLDLRVDKDVQDLVNWDRIVHTPGEASQHGMGFYTGLKRDNKTELTSLVDWNWLPAEIIEDWMFYHCREKHESTLSLYPRGENEDEL
ncbi:hypothetical protein B0T10DRAFT_606304 [Thelonectria olida]|uniref:Uncharacterized protein n=1 Tax=Thelonectria olida TaxID=1576542 RepID=A0A9P9AM59_9HYPO|nr:hypothetical protein B0T10DRAFT_606304 [Thelonectria olida]